jgi:hypothetical protein
MQPISLTATPRLFFGTSAHAGMDRAHAPNTMRTHRTPTDPLIDHGSP